MGFLDIANVVLGTAGLVLGGKQLFDPNKPNIPAAVTQAPGFMLEAGKAIADPTHPLFTALMNAERDRVQRQNLQTLQDIFTAHKRDVARGGPGFITTPDRRDENMWRSLMMQRELDNPAQRARAALAAASGAAGGQPSAALEASIQNFAQPLSQQAAGFALLGESLPRTVTSFESLFPTSNAANFSTSGNIAQSRLIGPANSGMR